MFRIGMRTAPLASLAALVTALVLAPAAAAHNGRDHGRDRGDHGQERGRLALVTESNPRPELVSGGEVLVRVDLDRGVNPGDVRIFSDGRDVTSSFHVQSDGDL